MAPVPVTVNYHPHRLISMILFIHFPGEPRIIIAFRANPISQPLILHQSLQSTSLSLHPLQFEKGRENKQEKRPGKAELFGGQRGVVKYTKGFIVIVNHA